MRIIDELANGTARSLDKVTQLRLRGHDQDEVGEVLRNVAALWERSLKASDASWSSLSLFEMAERLDASGWQNGSRTLHLVRRAANRDKHDAATNHRAEDAISFLRTLSEELVDLGSHLPGVMGDIPMRHRVRHMVCAVYEIFHHGETEYLFLEAAPDDTWQTVRVIDRFQIENKHCRAVEEQLAQLDSWEQNPDELRELHRSLLESDSELWLIARFNASYHQVHSIMAGYQHNLPLLGGLHREDSYGNLVASVAQALLSDETPKLVGRSRLDSDALRGKVEDLLDLVPDRLKPLRLDRCSPQAFADALGSAVVVDQDLRALVTDRGVLLIESR